MFLHLYKNRIRTLTRNRTVMFWSLLFPVLLGTLFFFAFGSADATHVFESIPVAAVSSGNHTELLQTMKSLENEGIPMFTVTECTKEEAEAKLFAGEVEGILMLQESVELLVTESEMNQTIIRSFLNQYRHMETLFRDAVSVNPEALENLKALMTSENSYLQNVTLGGEQLSDTLQYFYSLVAMASLYGIFFGLQNAEEIMASQSALAARRHIAPTHHMKQVVADMLAAFTIHFANTLVVVAYVNFVLGMEILSQPLLFLLVVLLGCITGVSLGQFIGSVSKKNEAVRLALSIGITMILCMLSGLMFAQMKYVVDCHAPVVNRLNPAALISESFYCLSIYGDYERFAVNLLTLAGIAAALVFGCFFAIRRSKYASI